MSGLRMGDERPWQSSVVTTLRASAALAMSSDAAWHAVGGNALSSVWMLTLSPARFFVKTADPLHADMLAAEVDALRAIREAAQVRVPLVFAHGQAQNAAFMAMEWLDFADGGRDAALGKALAQLHETTAERFGWHRDNTIGTTPQANAWSDDWAAFFRDQRLAPQLALADANGFGGTLQSGGQRLLDRVPELLAGHEVVPSLLHGDLWAGNAARMEDGSPAIFDPASYYGDREADLAMTELFGGFSGDFYAAYQRASPVAPGYPMRRTLYNLYHVLNHLNLFGSSYLARAEAMLDELLAHPR